MEHVGRDFTHNKRQHQCRDSRLVEMQSEPSLENHLCKRTGVYLQLHYRLTKITCIRRVLEAPLEPAWPQSSAEELEVGRQLPLRPLLVAGRSAAGRAGRR